MEAEILERLAELAVRFGANVQAGQQVQVLAELGKEPMARAVVQQAFKAGAIHVDVQYIDPWVKRARVEFGPDEALGFGPEWVKARVREIGDAHGSRIALLGAAEPGVLDGLDPDRLARDVPPAAAEGIRNLNEALENWTAVPCPTLGWAKLVHPDLEPEAALARLWEEVAYMCRLDTPDPVAAWGERFDVLKLKSQALADHQFDAMHLQAPGTDLTVGLFSTSKWLCADFRTSWGLEHRPNLPSEEVFTTPDPARANGVVRATKPLEREGQLILGLEVEFRDGVAVRIDAEQGAEVMRGYAGRDEGAARLGELALVDGHGRIGPMDTVFWTTLIDENAASHIALGQGFDWAVGEEHRESINTSKGHIDFMIGSPEMTVTGVAADGTRTPVLVGGDWQI